MVTMPDTSLNIELARKLLARVIAGDIDGMLEYVHPDVELHSPLPGGAAVKGREAVGEWFRGLTSEVTEFEARPFDYELVGECVVVRGYLWRRDGNALSERQVFWLYGFRDGLVVRMESHPTRTAALASANA